jgi:uridine kinase
MNKLAKRTFIVGLGGPSCTGKSSVAEKVASRLGGQVLSIESYYRGLSHLAFEERAKQNFDSPDAIDFELMEAQLREFASGQDVNVPLYDFYEHTRSKNRTTHVPWAPILIVEGILVLHLPELRQHFDLSVYLDAPDEICFHRRKVRDIVERQRAQDYILKQYEETVRPMAERYILPTRRFADLVINSQQPLDAVEAELLTAIRAITEVTPR